MRLDAFLAGMEDIKSRVDAKKIIEAGDVRVNGEVCLKPSTDVSNLDDIDYTPLSPAPIPKNVQSSIALDVLYEDEACLVIDKPAGLIVHHGSGTDANTETLIDALRPLFEKRQLPFSESAVLVHRLDKDTTGCLLVAKTPEAHMELQKQFAERKTTKLYKTIVYGVPENRSATIDMAIGRDTGNRTKMSVVRTKTARDAKTSYTVLSNSDNAAYLECNLHTGRTHQIRVHLSAIKHPVLGDDTYGSAASKAFSRDAKIPSLMLHAESLTFLSPDTKKSVTANSKLPTMFEEVMRNW